MDTGNEGGAHAITRLPATFTNAANLLRIKTLPVQARIEQIPPAIHGVPLPRRLASVGRRSHT